MDEEKVIKEAPELLSVGSDSSARATSRKTKEVSITETVDESKINSGIVIKQRTLQKAQ